MAAGIGYEVGGSGDASSHPTAAPTSTTTSTSTTTTTPAAAARPAAKHRFVSRPELEPPHLAVTVRSWGLAPGAILLSPSNGAVQAGALIAGDDGEPIWFRPLPFGMSATNLRVQEYRGAPALTWWEGVIRDGWGPGAAIIVDGSYSELVRLPAGNGIGADLHDFTLTPQGTGIGDRVSAETWAISQRSEGRRPATSSTRACRRLTSRPARFASSGWPEVEFRSLLR